MRVHSLHVAVSCSPPRGAWSWRCVQPGGRFTDGSGTEAHATSPRLRLHALVDGLTALADGTAVEVVTTDANTKRMVEEWLPVWAAAGWTKKRLQNKDLLKLLAPQLARLEVTFRIQERRTGDPHAKDCKLHAREAAKHMVVPDQPVLDGATVRNDVEVVAWTDGGARKNPGPSGWGFALVHLKSGATLIRRGGEVHATNNRMELTAILAALQSLTRRTRVEVRTDSKFAISVCEEWRFGWRRRGWKRANGEPPINLDIIRQLDHHVDQHDVRFTWVPGHTGEPGNELADTLCNQAIDDVMASRDPSESERRENPPFPITVAPPP